MPTVKRAQDANLHLVPIDESDRLSLAKWLLLGVGIMLLLGGYALVAVNNDKGQKVFDACVTILPPIATLVIGYYFSQRSKGH